MSTVVVVVVVVQLLTKAGKVTLSGDVLFVFPGVVEGVLRLRNSWQAVVQRPEAAEVYKFKKFFRR